jgi:KDO2-lipid IV(A) lauroyltransferase
MIKNSLSHLGIFLLSVLSLLPLSVLYGLAYFAYLIFYYVIGYRRKVVRENLQNSFPEKPLSEIIEIEHRYYKYMANLIVEIIKMDSLSKAQLQKRFIVKNMDLMDQYMKNGQSVLVSSGHYGNWEWGALTLGLDITGQNYTIYKPLNNVIYDNWFQVMRSKMGNKLVSMRQTLRAFQNSKNEATMFVFGNDQAPTREESHYWTTFLNQETSFQLGIEKIAKKSNQPVFYYKISVVKRGYYIGECIPLCLNPAETKEFEITEMHIRFLENLIKEDPAYWLWSHRRWKYKREH